MLKLTRKRFAADCQQCSLRESHRPLSRRFIKKSNIFVYTSRLIVGEYNDKLITTKVMSDIIRFVNLNIKAIEDFSDELISTDEFIDKLVSI
jgi:hypothetical protein